MKANKKRSALAPRKSISPVIEPCSKYNFLDKGETKKAENVSLLVFKWYSISPVLRVTKLSSRPQHLGLSLAVRITQHLFICCSHTYNFVSERGYKRCEIFKDIAG